MESSGPQGFGKPLHPIRLAGLPSGTGGPQPENIQKEWVKTMSKKVKYLIAILIVVVVLGGVLALLTFWTPAEDESTSSSSSSSGSAVSLYSHDSEEIQSVQIQYNGETYTMEKDGDGFAIPELEGLPADNTRFTYLANAASTLVASRLVEEDESKIAEYGLDDPLSLVDIQYTDGSSVSLAVGDEAPGSSGNYLLFDGKIYLVSSSNVSYFIKDMYSYLSTGIVDTLIDSSSGSLSVDPTSLTLGGSHNDPEVVIKKYTSTQNTNTLTTYGVTSPKQRDADSEVVSTLLTDLSGLSASSAVVIHPTQEQIAEYGLDNPYLTVELAYKDSESKRYEVSFRCSAANEEGIAYLMKDGVDVIYQISDTQTALSWYNYTYEDIISVMNILPYINDVSSVELELYGQSYLFELSGEDDELVITYQGQTLDTDIFRKLYQLLLSIKNDEYVEEPPDVSTLTSIGSLTYNYKSDSRPSDRLDFYEYSARQFYLSYNGDIEFLSLISHLDTIQNAVEKTLAGEDFSVI